MSFTAEEVMKLMDHAKELGISKIALKVRAHRGYALLRKFLKEQQDKENE